MKLTVYFKEHLIKEHFIEFDEVVIGSGEQCDLRIDSLAISNEHCRLYQAAGALYIETLDAKNPTVINDTTLDAKHTLKDGDTIKIGKHILEYSCDPELDKTQPTLRHKHEAKLSHAGCLQIMSGDNLGRIIRLSKPYIKLGKDGAASALISQKTTGYFISTQAENSTTKVNKQLISSDPHPLNEGDLIEIDGINMQFFQDPQ